MPAFRPTNPPSSQPTAFPTSTPTSQPSSTPTSSPSTFGNAVVTACAPLVSHYVPYTAEAYFIAHQVLEGADTSLFNIAGANASFVQTVQCGMNGEYAVVPMQVDITNVLKPAVSISISSDVRSLGTTPPQVMLYYTVKFEFPVPEDLLLPNAYGQVLPYYYNLTAQLTQFVLNGYFTAALHQYGLSDGDVFSSTQAIIPPTYFGPYLLTPVPSIQPASAPVAASENAASKVSNNLLAIILSVTLGSCCLLIIALVIQQYYLERKRAREADMETWTREADADVTIFKKQTNDDGTNPAYQNRPIIRAVRNAVVSIGRASANVGKAISDFVSSKSNRPNQSSKNQPSAEKIDNEISNNEDEDNDDSPRATHFDIEEPSPEPSHPTANNTSAMLFVPEFSLDDVGTQPRETRAPSFSRRPSRRRVGFEDVDFD